MKDIERTIAEVTVGEQKNDMPERKDDTAGVIIAVIIVAMIVIGVSIVVDIIGNIMLSEGITAEGISDIIQDSLSNGR